MGRPQGKWTDVFLAFRMTLDPRKLWLAFKGIVLSIVLVSLSVGVLACISHARGVRFRVGRPQGPAAGEQARSVCRRVTVSGQAAEPSEQPWFADTDVWGSLRRGRLGAAAAAGRLFCVALVRTAWGNLAERLPHGIEGRGSFVRVFWLVASLADVVVLLFIVWLVLLFVWSYYGAAIMRLTAVEYALGERIEIASAVAYARRKHHQFYGAPLILVGVMTLLAIGIVLLGAVAAHFLVVAVFFVGLLASGVAAAMVHDKAQSGWAGLAAGVGGLVVTVALCGLLGLAGWGIPYVGEVVAGVLSPFAVLAGLLIAVVGIWLLLGLGLMFGALCSSDGDVFEAWSRSFHYLFSHPWLYGFVLVVAAAYGLACLSVVYVIREAAETAMLWPLSAGLAGRFTFIDHYMAGGGVGAGSGGDRVLACFLLADRFLLDLIFVAFVAVFKLVAVTIVYFVLRSHADGTAPSEVHLEPRDREFLQPPVASEPA